MIPQHSTRKSGWVEPRSASRARLQERLQGDLPLQRRVTLSLPSSLSSAPSTNVLQIEGLFNDIRFALYQDWLFSLLGGYAGAGGSEAILFYARKRNISYEVADPDKRYDLLIIAYGGATDVSRWLRYKKAKTRIVFDMVDSYLTKSSTSRKTIGRGMAKFVVRQNRYLIVHYKEALREMCRRSNSVVCSTEEQRADILKLCPVVHNILDFHSAEAKAVKIEFESGSSFQFIWEGLPGNVCTFEECADRSIESFKEHVGKLHIITDPTFGAYLGGRVGKRDTETYARTFLDVPSNSIYGTQPLWRRR